MVDREIDLSCVVPAGDSFHGANPLPAQATEHAVLHGLERERRVGLRFDCVSTFHDDRRRPFGSSLPDCINYYEKRAWRFCVFNRGDDMA